MPLAQRRDYHQTIEYAGVMELGGWRAVALPGALVFVQRTPSRTFAKMQRPARIDVDALHRLCAALAIDELHVEPGLVVDLVARGVTRLAYAREDEAAYIGAFARAGLAPIATRWAHSKTLVADTRASHDELVATFDRKVRQESGYAYSGVRYEACSFDEVSRVLLDEMAPLHAQWRERDHGTYDERFLASLRRCFGRDGAVIVARANRELGAHTAREPSAHADREPSAHADRELGAHADREPSAHADREPSAHADREPSAHADREPSAHADLGAHALGAHAGRELDAHAEREPSEYAERESGAHANEIVGAMHVLFVDRVAICFDSFTVPAARDSFANTGLFLEAARAGRDRGCDLLDLCACWDERIPDAHPDWKGFTTFKQKFSSTEIYYPPTFALQSPRT